MEESSSESLPDPISKKSNVLKREYPFPIIRSNVPSGTRDPKWRCSEGYLEKDCVIVREDASIKLLYTHGFFGKGTLSKHTPKVCFNNEDEANSQPEASTSKSAEMEIIDVIDVDDDDDNNKSEGKSNIKEEEIEIVISDSDSNEIPLSKKSKKSTDVSVIAGGKAMSENQLPEEKEYLQLLFEEAYFLSFALGCLVVRDNKNQLLDLPRLWNKLCEADEDFPVKYTAYHHFRSKGWVVKTGIKYGVDYILYKEGPPFYHATYSVIVKHVKEQNFREVRNNRQLTWASLLSLNRINRNAKKALLFLYVIRPSTMSENKVSTPYCISQYKVEEVVFNRWVSSEHREDSD